MTLPKGSAPAIEAIKQGRSAFLRGLLYVGVLSAFINTLQLTVPLFTLQMQDRVFNSRSIDTLILLSGLAAGALVLYGALEFIRSLTFIVLGSRLIGQLNLPTLEAAALASA